ncbi:Elongation factor P--(R)-beta-lysine ligase [Anatilimnocola aggregata]|uniref:Elongation factor P--(R)-beta-lysine ligase n=1 Tax=Anatilimnocola aggregata TaxID=2528021 RepID=A0A517YNY1_9BACT|nr:EF-P lysine aminoacylase EpmA [Anatilimnocola aggregata]QDU31924.1 Elongation factor P--(R)-beta-lysine ligase [Anatilimnocola aggregata]
MSSDFLPSCSLDMLHQRAELLRRLRRFFDSHGFVEVETPTLSRDSVIDEHLDPLRVTLFQDAREPDQGEPFYLQTSPEFGMKRLLVAGATAIYQITRAYRGGEAGPLHNPEFTMLEWYRVGDDYEDGRRLLSNLASAAIGCDDAEQITFREAFQRHAQVDPFTADVPQLGAALQANGKEVAANEQDRAVLLDRLLTECVEPKLGQERPTILYDYPANQSALAQVRPADDQGNPAVAERFELYIRGVELANGYHELLDPAVLIERNRQNNARRAGAGKYQLPEQSRLVAAMQHGLPACSGCALGVDRLLLIAANATSIQQVLAFPIERA